MKIAILMSTYNGEKYIEEQIESILAQEIDIDIEPYLIIRDDGSTDGTLNVIAEYAAKGKLQYTVGYNIGGARGFMQLLHDNPGYDYYAFADQDDVWNEDKLQKGIIALDGIQGPALYCSNGELVDSTLNKLGRNTHRNIPNYTLTSILCLASCAQGCTAVFNKDLAEIIQKNDIPDVFIMHDSLLTCLCGLVNGKIIYDDIPSMKYRIHGNNVFGMTTAKHGILNVVKDRIKEITQKRKVSMCEQAESILNTYKEYIPDNNQRLCRKIINSKYSVLCRLHLILSPELKHDTFNKTIAMKLAILLGNN